MAKAALHGRQEFGAEVKSRSRPRPRTKVKAPGAKSSVLPEAEPEPGEVPEPGPLFRKAPGSQPLIAACQAEEGGTQCTKGCTIEKMGIVRF